MTETRPTRTDDGPPQRRSRLAVAISWAVAPRRCRSLTRLGAAVGGKTIVVTGASFGIGEATTRLVASAGAEVILVARSADKLDELVARITADGGRATGHGLVRARRPRTVDRVELRQPGCTDHGDAARMTAQGGGQLVSVSTFSALQPGAPRWGTCQGSKGGFDIWLRSIATELRPQHIAVTSVYMPLVRTRMSASTPLYDRLPALTPHEAAQVVARALVRRGDRVAPQMIEDRVCAEFDAVRECAVVAIPDDSEFGSELHLFAVLAPGCADTVESLLRQCERQLPRVVRPTRVTLVDTLPRNLSGELVRRRLESVAGLRSSS